MTVDTDAVRRRIGHDFYNAAGVAEEILGVLCDILDELRLAREAKHSAFTVIKRMARNAVREGVQQNFVAKCYVCGEGAPFHLATCPEGGGARPPRDLQEKMIKPYSEP